MTRSISFFALPCVVFGLLTTPDCEAQSPAFEVASIKPDTDPPNMVIVPGLRHGTLHGEKITLRVLLAIAYGMTEPRVFGPDWLDKNRFDIVAKSPPGVPDSEMRPMLLALLKERFQLTAHLEAREMAVYYLVVAKSGVKMPVYPAQDGAGLHPGNDPDIRGFPMMRGVLTTSQLSDRIASLVSRPVIDKTGLTERYSLFLSCAPLSPRAGDRVPEFGPPDLFAALQKQLGLKLEAGKDNVKVVVVDHIEQMPTEN
jgi:uncharacterized protein (TIGR03435 family)